MGDSDALGRAHSFIDDQDFNLDDTLFADDDDDGTDDLGNIFNDSNDSLNFSASKVETDIDTEKGDGAGDESNEKSSSDNEQKTSSSSRKKKNKKKGGVGDTSSSKQQPKKRRRSSLSVDGSRAGPPPSWHNQAADKPHRDKMIREMYVYTTVLFKVL
jgi:hypothetical protein